MSDITSSPCGRGRIDALQAALSQFEQLNFHTDHFFFLGIYARRLEVPRGAIIVGKAHKEKHLFIIAKGSIAVDDGNGARVLVAGETFVSYPGVKRAGYAIEDSVCITIHRTDSEDVEQIERDLIEPDGTALLDAFNRPRRIAQ